MSAIAAEAAKRAMGCLRHAKREPYEADAAALEELRPWLEQLSPGDRFDALEELARVACFLDLSKKSPGAAQSLLALASRIAQAQQRGEQAAR